MVGVRVATSACRSIAGKAAGAALLTVSLAGCGGMGEQTVSSALVTPGKYEFHSCRDIVNGIRGQRARQADLERVMAQSSQGFAGELVNVIAYRTEYAQTQGELAVLRKAAEDKQCATQSEWSSERALF
jgi:hypothetical protein